ncbi:MAG: hypothetical protein VB959_23870 [Rhodospirillales bacterium]
MTVPRQELPQYLWAAVTAFNMENGKLIIQRGMMGIEKLSFVDQEILVLDREGAVACTGRYDPQDDRQGYFHLNCASRNLKATWMSKTCWWGGVIWSGAPKPTGAENMPLSRTLCRTT